MSEVKLRKPLITLLSEARIALVEKDIDKAENLLEEAVESFHSDKIRVSKITLEAGMWMFTYQVGVPYDDNKTLEQTMEEIGVRM